MRLGKPTLFSFAAIFSLSSLGAGQTPSAPAAPTLHVYSRETIVDVLVTDDKGQPVRGQQDEPQHHFHNRAFPTIWFRSHSPCTWSSGAMERLSPTT